MADEKKRLTSYPEATELQDDDYVMVDNGGPEGTRKFLAKNLGGSSGYSETTLYYSSSGLYQDAITLNDDYTNYDALIFRFGSLSENNMPWTVQVPTSQIVANTENNISARVVSFYADAGFTPTSTNTFSMNVRSNANKCYKIIGVKY